MKQLIVLLAALTAISHAFAGLPAIKESCEQEFQKYDFVSSNGSPATLRGSLRIARPSDNILVVSVDITTVVSTSREGMLLRANMRSEYFSKVREELLSKIEDEVTASGKRLCSITETPREDFIVVLE